MSKRFAGSQMTREGLENGDSRSGSDDETGMEKPKIASESVMSTRKIAMPKRKMGNFNTGEKPNMFKLMKNNNTNVGIKFQEKDTTADTNEKIAALNLQFKSKIVATLDSDPVADLSLLFDKYKTYLQSLKPTKVSASETPKFGATSGFTNEETKDKPKADDKPKPAFAFNKPADSKSNLSSTPVQPAKKVETKAESESDSDDEKKPAVSVEGPKFVLSKKPTTSDPPFSFQKKKRREPSSDSDSEVEVKGPQFTFTGTLSSKTFQLPKTEQSNTTAEESKKKDVPASIFGNSSSRPSPEFGSKPETDSSGTKPTFPSFGSIKSDSGNTTAAPTSQFSFSFGGANKDTKTENASTICTSEAQKNGDSNSKPSLSFPVPSSSTENTKQEDKEQVKPSFTFGAPAQTNATSTESSKPSFTFGAPAKTNDTSTESSKPSFTFGAAAKADTSTDSSKPSFTFGAAAKNNTSTDSSKPSFTFGTVNNDKKNNDSSKPSFTFGSNQSNTTASFTFGKQDTEKKDEKKPTFTFGSSAAPAVPAFSFGAKKEENTQMQDSSSGFKFSLPFAPTTSSADSDSAKKHDEQKSTDNNTEEAAKEEEEPSKALNLTNGEENENLLFSQRAKLMIFNSETKAYDSRGVGEFKILQSKEDKSKARLLCRSDGMGHILLNTSVVKSFSYEALDPNNENLVKCPVVNPEGGLDTYVIKVKQKADGRKLIQAIKDAQQQM